MGWMSSENLMNLTNSLLVFVNTFVAEAVLKPQPEKPLNRLK